MPVDGAQAVHVGQVVAGRQGLALGRSPRYGDISGGQVIHVRHLDGGCAAERFSRSKAIGVAGPHADGLAHLGLRQCQAAARSPGNRHAVGQPLPVDGAQAVHVGQGVTARQGLALGGRTCNRDAAGGPCVHQVHQPLALACAQLNFLYTGGAAGVKVCQPDLVCRAFDGKHQIIGHTLPSQVCPGYASTQSQSVRIPHCAVHVLNHILAATSQEHINVIACPTAEHITRCIARQGVGQLIARAVDGGCAGERQVLHVRGQGVAHASVHRVRAFACSLCDDRLHRVKHIAIVPCSAFAGIQLAGRNTVCGTAVTHLQRRRLSLSIEALGVDACATAVLAVGLPTHHKPAIGQRRNVGVGLAVHDSAIDLELCALRLALRVVALGIDTLTAAILIERLPAHHKTTPRQRGDARIGLSVQGGAVDPKLCTLRLTQRVVTLGVNAITTAVLVTRRPTHHKATTGQRGNAGGQLVKANGAVDPELRALHLPLRVVALGIDAVAVAILTQ